MTYEALCISDFQRTFQIYLDNENKIGIDEIADGIDSQSVFLPLEDWPVIKKYIDKMYRDYKNQNSK